MGRSDWPIIVGGCLRSGTSLLRRIFDAHPRIHCGPEVKFFRDLYGDYFEDPLKHLRLLTTARTLLPADDVLSIFGSAFVKLHERAALQAGKQRWADKVPENVLYLQDWERLLGDQWLLVHVVRNPLDTLASFSETRFPLSLPSALDDRIAFYRRYVEAGLAWAAKHPDRCFQVVYEELVSDPQGLVPRLMAWAGEEFDPVQLSFNELPHQKGLEDPKIETTTEVHSMSIGRWVSVLREEEASRIWTDTRDLWFRIDPSGAFSAGVSRR